MTDSGRSGIAAIQWKDAEANLVILAGAGLSMAIPLAIGVTSGRIAEGMLACLGALIVSSSAHEGSLRHRITDIAWTTAAGSCGIAFGLACAHELPLVSLVVAAAVLATVGGVRRSWAKAGAQAIAFMLVAVSLPPALSAAAEVLWVAVGALFGGLMTLIAVGFELHVRRQPLTAALPFTPLRNDLAAWRTRLRTVRGWVYPLRLTTSLAVALAAVEVLHRPHAYWIMLTVALVVQRDHRSAFGRSVERGVGTAIGIVVGSAVLSVPLAVGVVAVGVIGAVRPYLKQANYTAYTIAMTPLVVILQSMGRPMPASLLVERLVDTALGCLISVVFGLAVWWRLIRPGAHDGAG